jgi:hypothetical protein
MDVQSVATVVTYSEMRKEAASAYVTDTAGEQRWGLVNTALACAVDVQLGQRGQGVLATKQADDGSYSAGAWTERLATVSRPTSRH